MRALLIDDDVRKRVHRVLDHALDPKNWYRLGYESLVPGHDSRFVVHLNSFRCVFTITTRKDGLPFRHLSISVPQNYPNPIAAFTIAELFGFTGWDGKSGALPSSWMSSVNEQEHCIVLAEPYTEAKASA